MLRAWFNLDLALWWLVASEFTNHLPSFPSTINNGSCSPCLSFNSIFTPCQLHLEPLHHHCSPSAGIPLQDLCSPLIFDERSNNGSWGVLPMPLWLFFEFFFIVTIWYFTLNCFLKHHPHFLPKGFLPFPAGK